MAKQVKIPKLPYGQGNMQLRPNGTIMYRKRIFRLEESIPS